MAFLLLSLKFLIVTADVHKETTEEGMPDRVSVDSHTMVWMVGINLEGHNASLQTGKAFEVDLEMFK